MLPRRAPHQESRARGPEKAAGAQLVWGFPLKGSIRVLYKGLGGLGVSGLGFRGLGVWGLGFRVSGFEFRV